MTNIQRKGPLIAVSMGDPAGISPEVVAANIPVLAKICTPIIFGHWPSIEKIISCAPLGVEIELVESPELVSHGGVGFVHCGPDGDPIDEPGPAAASAQFESLRRAVDYCLSSSCNALVTAPVAKDLVATVSPGFTGHTEYLARQSGLQTDQVTMVFASKKLCVGLVSTHVPMSQVVSALTRTRVDRTIAHLVAIRKAVGSGGRCRIGVAALNPHAGENGLLGTEEVELLKPLVREYSNRQDMELVGPIPADSLFRDALAGEYDAVVSTYHDQAMIPLKLGGVGQTVNVTMGLPFVRTSPDHGVAYDIAGKGLADPSGMKSAIDLAVALSIIDDI